jgi:hypothetical protein
MDHLPRNVSHVSLKGMDSSGLTRTISGARDHDLVRGLVKTTVPHVHVGGRLVLPVRLVDNFLDPADEGIEFDLFLGHEVRREVPDFGVPFLVNLVAFLGGCFDV